MFQPAFFCLTAPSTDLRPLGLKLLMKATTLIERLQTNSSVKIASDFPDRNSGKIASNFLLFSEVQRNRDGDLRLAHA